MNMTATELARLYLTEVAAHGRLELIETLAHENMIDEANRAFGGPPGRAGLVAHVTGFRRAIADLEIGIARIASGLNAAGEEEVMACWHFSGRLERPWLGHAPTGRPISGDVVSIFTLRDGRIAHYRLWLAAQFESGPVVFDSGTALRAAMASGTGAEG